jgi:hypothetical protein
LGRRTGTCGATACEGRVEVVTAGARTTPRAGTLAIPPRHDPSLASRTADKHRNHAAELGVDLYLGKPYQEDELLSHLREMTGVAAL